MNLKVYQIQEYLKQNKHFKTIKNIDIFAEKLVETYPIIDIVSELRKMSLWIDVNHQKKNYGRYIVNWLNSSNRSNIWKIKT